MNAYVIERRATNRLPPVPASGDALGLRAAVDAILQHGKLALLVFALTLAAALAYLFLTAPVYRADTLLQIDSRPRAPLLPALNSSPGSAETDRVAMSGEIEILRSRELLIPIIKATGVDIQLSGARRHDVLPIGERHRVRVTKFDLPDSQRGRDFTLDVNSARWQLSDADGTRIASGEVGRETTFKISGADAALTLQAPAGLAPTRFTLRLRDTLKAYEDVVERMRMFEPSRDSGLVRISFEDKDPARAATLLNLLAASYVAQAVDRKAAEGAKTLAYLSEQLPILKSRVEAAEDALSSEQTSSQPTPLTTEADALLRQRGDLERQLTELQVKRDLLAQTYTPAHKDLAAVLAQIRTVRSTLGRLGAEVRQLPAQQRDTVRLQRDVQISTQLYTTLLAQVQQLRITNAGGLAPARQLDVAAAPVEPYRPKPLAVLSIGAGLGLVLALLAVLLRRTLQPTVTDAQELQSQASVATLALIPESDAQLRLMEGRLKEEVVEDLGTHRLLVRAAPEDPAVESLRSVHLSLLMRARSAETKVILVTAPSSGTGKAFVAANLAALMADAGEQVLLIDTDLRKPGVHKYVLMDKYAPGMSDVLCGIRRLDEVIRPHATVKSLDVILHGTGSANPGGTLMAQGFDSAMADLRRRYDRIVINAAPLLPSGDALAVGRMADVALLVVRAERSLLQETRTAQRRLQQAGIPLEGLLFNGVKRKRLSAPALP